MKSVGEKLRRERLQRGMDLAALSSLTRINRRYLEAIESAQTEQLPGGFFYRSFVRQYANALGLDAAEIEEELERERQADTPVLTSVAPEPEFPLKTQDPIVTESNRRYLGRGRMGAYVVLLGAVLVGCSAFYAWWHRLETAPVEKRMDVAVSAPSTPVAPMAAPATETVPPPATEPESSAPRSVPEAAALTPVAASPAGPKTPAVSPEDKVIVKLVATETTWLSVTTDGRAVFAGLLQPNQEITLGGKERAQIKIGNAGGLAVSWNGKTIGPVGVRGQVRSVLLTPDGYHVTVPDGSL